MGGQGNGRAREWEGKGMGGQRNGMTEYSFAPKFPCPFLPTLFPTGQDNRVWVVRGGGRQVDPQQSVIPARSGSAGSE